jgi:GTPase SAR1 family protein
VSSIVVETIAAAGMIFVRERRTALIWSARGELLAWSLGETPAQLGDREPPSRNGAAYFTRLAVSPVDGLLALIDAGAAELLLVSAWESVISALPATTTYANAKVLLLGDSGVGKSGLAMVLAGEEFMPTESTHGRRIWRLPAADEPESAGDSREVMLWDLAGQPGYRIVHQLHLEGAALALILFDAKSETTPLAGVRHWARAVRHAHPAAEGELHAFLVAARADRGGINVSDQRIQKLMADFGLAQYFRTSAKEGMDTDLLRSRLLAAIDWSRIPEVASTTLFAAVKQFIMEQKSSILLTPINELGRQSRRRCPAGCSC